MRQFLVFSILMTFLFPMVAEEALGAAYVGRKVSSSEGATNRFRADGLKLRKTRRVAVGTKVGGSSGLAGANIELNFTPRIGFVAGYGGGSGFQTYSFELKQYIGGDSFLPYVGAGFTRWFGRERDEGLQESTPRFLSEKFLTETEKASGEFELDMIYPSLGVQYVNLDGDYAGFSLFAEVIMLIDIAEFVSAPTASVGMMYYF